MSVNTNIVALDDVAEDILIKRACHGRDILCHDVRRAIVTRVTESRDNLLPCVWCDLVQLLRRRERDHVAQETLARSSSPLYGKLALRGCRALTLPDTVSRAVIGT
jgi:hypothetical protein